MNHGHVSSSNLRISRSPESQRLWTDIQPHPLASTISANVACISKNVKLMFFFLAICRVNYRFPRLNDLLGVVCCRINIRPLGCMYCITSILTLLTSPTPNMSFESLRHTMHLQLLYMIHHPRTTDCIFTFGGHLISRQKKSWGRFTIS